MAKNLYTILRHDDRKYEITMDADSYNSRVRVRCLRSYWRSEVILEHTYYYLKEAQDLYNNLVDTFPRNKIFNENTTTGNR